MTRATTRRSDHHIHPSLGCCTTVRVSGLDHVVLTVRDVDVTVDFYERVLGMRRVEFADGKRVALAFGAQKLNLHPLGNEFMPNAREARPGSADLCLLVETPLAEVLAHLERENVEIEYGPDDADGATDSLRSVWIRDPDGNLVELAQKPQHRAAPAPTDAQEPPRPPQ